MTIGDRIKQRRLEIDMSQEELAKKVGYKDRSTVSYIEKNGDSLTMQKVKEIAEALRTTPSWLMGWDEEDDNRTALLQDIYDKNRILFDAADDATPEQIKQAAEYLEFLKRQKG